MQDGPFYLEPMTKMDFYQRMSNLYLDIRWLCFGCFLHV